MALTAGEFFINLGIKGADKTIGALSNVKKGFGEITSTSLEAKAAILAAAYAFERLMAASGAVGTSLTNFGALTGVSMKTLQQYQYAARQVGISNESMAGSFKSVQKTMNDMLRGKGAPEGMAMLKGKVGFDFNKAEDPKYVLDKLQQYAQAEKNVGLRNMTMRSFGLGDDVIAGMARNAFRPEVMGKAPTYGDKEIGQLDRANIAWSNLGNTIEMAFGHFNAKHGMELVNDISKVTTQVIKLIEAFTTLAEKLKVFQVLGKVFEGWASIFGLASQGVDKVTGAASSPKKREQLGADFMDFFKEMPSVFKAMGEDIFGPSPAKPSVSPGMIAPEVPKSSGGSTQQNVNVNQTLNFQHDGKDHKKTGDSTKKAIHDAYRQIPAQTQGS